MFSTRRVILCLLLVVSVAVCGHAQSIATKESTASISGKVTFKGEGLQGVIITLRVSDAGSSRKLTNYRGVTDAKGEYRIANVPAGTYTVTPAAAAFVGEEELGGERSLIVNKDENIENLDFSLIRGGVITGKVVDADGQPQIEEEVRVTSARNPSMRSGRPDAITDDRGVYRVFALRPGNYTVAAGRDEIGRTASRSRGAVYARTYYPATADPSQATVIKVSDGSEATNIDIVLGRPLTSHSASGRVVDGATGRPVPNAPYGVTQIITPTSTVTSSQGAVTNSQGEFKLENLVPGQYAVSVRPDQGDWRAEDVRFEIVDQDVTGLIVKTERGSSLSGVVVFEGDQTLREKLGKARLIFSVITAPRSGGPAFASAVGPDGSFHVGGLPAGNVLVSLASALPFRIIRIERDGIVQVRGIELKQTEDIKTLRIVLGLADASLRGSLVVENGTIPPNGQLFVWARNTAASAPVFAVAKIDARGQFVFENLLPGTYELTSGIIVQGSREPLVSKKQEVTVASGSIGTVTIKLDLNPPKP